MLALSFLLMSRLLVREPFLFISNKKHYKILL